MMIDTEARRRMVNALERIADALERANEADPLLAIQAALDAGQPDQLDQSDPNDDMPEYLRRLIER